MPNSRTCSLQPCPSILHSARYGFIRFRVGILNPVGSGAVVRRVDHGTYDVHIARNLLHFLADAKIIVRMDGQAEHVRRNPGSSYFKPLSSVLKKGGDGVFRITVLARIYCVRDFPIAGKPDVVELDLAETVINCILCHINQIRPRFLPVGIDVGKAFIVRPQTAVYVPHRPLRFAPGPYGILEAHDTSYGDNLPLPESGNQPGHIDALHRHVGQVTESQEIYRHTDGVLTEATSI